MDHAVDRPAHTSPWCWLLRSILLPAGDIVFGQSMMRRLRFLEKMQWWNRERLEPLRNDLLREVIATAFNEVPFYRHLMEQAAVTPQDIREPEDLRRLPIVTKDLLRAGYPHETTRPTGQKTYEKRTSGSTGKNFVVLEDAATAGWYRASFMLALQWSGWQIGQPQLQTGMTFQRGLEKRLKDKLLGCYYVSAAALDDQSLDRSLEVLDRKSIDFIWGYPGSIHLLARRAVDCGWNRPIRSVVTWGDNLYQGYRRTIETAFRTRVFDTYGCAEGVQVAAQCGTGDHYHLHDLDTIVEFVDERGNPVPNDKPGLILLTRLHAGPMPLIRYQLGDVGIAGDLKPCPCGRGYRTMQSVQGRDTDIVVTPSGNRLIVHYFTGLLEHFSEIDSFQVRQDEVESITLLIVPTKAFGTDTTNRIKATLKGLNAPDLRIDVEVVNKIPVSPAGKRRFVVSTLARRDSPDVSGPEHAKAMQADT
jgi:phenylacetate-coenzyme A ligase PaaK-like adenylate-forming protein